MQSPWGTGYGYGYGGCFSQVTNSQAMGVTCITPSPPSSHPLLSCPTSPLRKTAQISSTLALNFQPKCCLRMLQCLSWRSSTLQESFSGLVFGDNLLQSHLGVGLGKSRLSCTVWSCKFRNWQARWIADKTRVPDERRYVNSCPVDIAQFSLLGVMGLPC